MPLVVRVVPDVSGLDKEFDYLVPEPLRDQVRVGTLVRIPLHGRRVGGWVVAVIDAGESVVPVDRLKPIAKVTGHGPGPEIVELARWAAHRWAGPLRAVLRSASPDLAIRQLPPPRRRPHDVAPVAGSGFELPGRVLRLAPAASVVPAIESAAELGPMLLIVPSVERAGLAAARLRGRGFRVAELPGEWAAAAGGVDVVVGARASIWASVPGLAVIVVLDEHDEALQEERSPNWHARDVAVERARRSGIPCLLVSSVPSLVARHLTGFGRVDPSRTEERDGWPQVEIVDLGDDDPWVTSLVTSPLIRELRDETRRVVCVLNVTGRARRLACKVCREMAACESCGTPVSEPTPSVLACARCGTRRPKVCQACGSARLVSLRPGVSRLREELEAAAGRPVAEVTAAAAPPDSSADHEPEPDVFVGTEAVLHRVRRIDTVAFLDLDGELLAPRYRAGEHVLALVARAARLAGSRAQGGRLIVQTYLPKHPIVEAIRFADPDLAVEELEGSREALGFPPFGALASISGLGSDEFAAALRLGPGVGDLRVMGPADGRYLVRASDPARLADALASVPHPPHSRLRVEVDPPRI